MFGLVFSLVPTGVEHSMNEVSALQPHVASDEANALHAKLVVVDLHADSLLFGRDLFHESQNGHVDFPRMRRANVALEAFTVVTKSPKGQNVDSYSAEAQDRFTTLVMASLWPIRTW